MILKILTSKVVTGLAYTLIGSDLAKSVVRKELTVENARKVAGAIGRTAAATGRSVKASAGSLRSAVCARKDELLTKDDEDSPI